MMEVGFTRRVLEGPIGKRTVEIFDDCGKAKSQTNIGLKSHQTIEAKNGAQLQCIGAPLYGDLWLQSLDINRTAVSIIAKLVRRPLTGRREIELVVFRIVLRTDEEFKTGVPPQVIRSANWPI